MGHRAGRQDAKELKVGFQRSVGNRSRCNKPWVKGQGVNGLEL